MKYSQDGCSFFKKIFKFTIRIKYYLSYTYAIIFRSVNILCDHKIARLGNCTQIWWLMVTILFKIFRTKWKELCITSQYLFVRINLKNLFSAFKMITKMSFWYFDTYINISNNTSHKYTSSIYINDENTTLFSRKQTIIDGII